MDEYIKEEMGLEDSCDVSSCESCEGCAEGICQSCGMPMTTPLDFGGGDTASNYCVHCCHDDGSLKSYDEVLEGVTTLMMTKRNMDRDTAARAARDYLSIMPAWGER